MRVNVNMSNVMGCSKYVNVGRMHVTNWQEKEKEKMFIQMKNIWYYNVYIH